MTYSLEPKPLRVSPHVLSENESMNWLLKIFFLLIAIMLLSVMLLFSLLGLLVGLLRWLITGQKPQMAVMFSTYRQWQKQAAQHMRGRRSDEDIIEAEVREVPTTRLEDKR
jgi:type VI protein secretion system component VasK